MICLFCGNEMEVKYDEYTPYYECNCSDAVEDRKITEKISMLNASRPKHRFKFVRTLRKISPRSR